MYAQTAFRLLALTGRQGTVCIHFPIIVCILPLTEWLSGPGSYTPTFSHEWQHRSSRMPLCMPFQHTHKHSLQLALQEQVANYQLARKSFKCWNISSKFHLTTWKCHRAGHYKKPHGTSKWHITLVDSGCHHRKMLSSVAKILQNPVTQFTWAIL